MRAIDHLPHTLYRFYDKRGRLLYIGIALEFLGRWRKHRKRDWWPQVARMEIEPHPSRIAALAAERAAIIAERPRHNIQHNRLMFTEGSAPLDSGETRLARVLTAPWAGLHPVLREIRMLVLSLMAAGGWLTAALTLVFSAPLGAPVAYAMMATIFAITHCAWRTAARDAFDRPAAYRRPLLGRAARWLLTR